MCLQFSPWKFGSPVCSTFLYSWKGQTVVFGYTLVGVWLLDKTTLFVFNILLLGVWISNEALLPVFDILLLGVWISDETLPLVFDILLLGVWTSDETLLLVFDILLLGVCISDETLPLVSDILLLGVLDIPDETLFLCLIYCFSLFGYMLFGCLNIRWNTSPCLDISWNTPSRASHITSLCSEIRWNTCVYSWVLCIVFVSLCKGNRRSNF